MYRKPPVFSAESTSATPLGYGSWPSSIGIEQMLTSSDPISGLKAAGNNLYWLRRLNKEDGRNSIFVYRTDSGDVAEVTPGDVSVRSRVMEYGGGTHQVAGSIVVFCDDTAHCVKAERDGQIFQLTPESTKVYFADFEICPELNLVIAVREDHRVLADGAIEPETCLVALRLDGQNSDFGQVLASGASFYANPTVGSKNQLAWVEWDHPFMPWDTTRLMAAQLASGDIPGLSGVTAVLDKAEVSVFHPRFSGDGDLVAMADLDGFWNLHCWPKLTESLTNLTALPAPVKLGGEAADYDFPMWVLGNQSWDFIDQTHILCFRMVDGLAELGVIDLADGSFSPVLCQANSSISYVSSICGGEAEKPTGYAVVCWQDHDDQVLQIVWEPDFSDFQINVIGPQDCAPADLNITSIAKQLSFTGRYGTSYLWFYPPKNTDFVGLPGELPPMIMRVHGGPTAFCSASLDAEVQFWTSRGFAFCMPNYSGSSGYGRAYRNRLRSNWGVADVADLVDAVKFLADEKLIDANRVVIEGGSAGGYSVLACLADSDLFAGGISRYGIADIEALAKDTHKFESHYTDLLIASYPEGRAIYQQRSPITKVDQFTSPMLILQGSEDKVVPPNQAEMIAEALTEKGLAAKLIIFDGEGHGFRKLANRRQVVVEMIEFLSELFNLDMPAAD